MTSARLILAGAALLLLSACATGPRMGPPPPPPPPKGAPPSATVFRSQDFSWSAVPGKGRIDGHLSFRTGARRYVCSGASVILTPETPWTRRRMTILYNSPTSSALPVEQVRARTPSAPSGDYSAFIRRTTCDAGDRFSFQGLANGGWFVILVAKPQGGGAPEMAIMRRVEIKGGRAVALEL
ncbi:MAG TPA: hypothetical protein VFW47_10205 [Phenylobacterium sp.]|nr:hypothetical protein [Phenylobacterium sp.]